MERLTTKTKKGAALKMADSYESETAARQDLMARYRVAVDRLAAYEDTGLEPEKVEILSRSYPKMFDMVDELNAYRSLGSIDHLRKLIEAEQTKEAIEWYEAKLAINKERGFSGPQNDAAYLAITALRAQAEAESNEPLTQEELPTSKRKEK